MDKKTIIILQGYEDRARDGQYKNPYREGTEEHEWWNEGQREYKLSTWQPRS